LDSLRKNLDFGEVGFVTHEGEEILDLENSLLRRSGEDMELNLFEVVEHQEVNGQKIPESVIEEIRQSLENLKKEAEEQIVYNVVIPQRKFIQKFLQNIKKQKRLKEIEEKQQKRLEELEEDRKLHEAACNGDIAARDKLVLKCKPIMGNMAYRASERFKIEVKDLFQEAWTALLKYFKEYDPNRGLTFKEFSPMLIRRGLTPYCEKNRSEVKIATTSQRNEVNYKEFFKIYITKNGRPPDVDEISEALNITLKAAKRLKEDAARFDGNTKSIEAPVSNDCESRPLLNFLKVQERSFDEVYFRELIERVYQIVNNNFLEENRERNYIIFLRHLMGFNNVEIGNEFNITRAAVSQTLLKIFSILQTQLQAEEERVENLEDFSNFSELPN